MHRRSSPFVLLALLALTTTACGWLVPGLGSADRVDTTTREVTHRPDLEESQPLRLLHPAGRVTVTGGTSLQLHATVHANAGGDEATAALLESVEWIEMRDKQGRRAWGLRYPVQDHRRFHVNPPEEGFGSSRSSLRYLDRDIVVSTSKGSAPTLYADLEITVPRGLTVDVVSHLGPIDARDMDGEISLDTGSGNIKLERLQGRLTVDTGSGNVEGRDLKGEVMVDTGSGNVDIVGLVGNGVVDTGSGNVEVQDIAMGRLRLDTGSGNVRVTGGEAGRLELDTGSGNVKLRDVVAQEIDADTGSGNILLDTRLATTRRIVADTGSGNLEIRAEPDAAFQVRCRDLRLGYDDADVTRRDGDIVAATRGTGGPVLELSTGSGDCRLRPAG